MTDENKTALRQAYQAATTALREAHRDEFNDLYKKEAAARNVEWSPRKTQKEKDADEFARLLRENPEFAERVAREE